MSPSPPKQKSDPSFLIIGAQKCATTWLSRTLNRHPEIYIPKRKEIHFFNKRYNYNKGLSWYREHFGDRGETQIAGEATPNYFWTSSKSRDLEESHRTSNIPGLVHKHYPDIKLIVILRDPVQRAVSAFKHHIRDRVFPPKSRITEVGHRRGIFSMGFYDIDLAMWLDYFSRDQFKIIIFEEGIKKNKKKTINEIFDFLHMERFPIKHLNKKYNQTEGHLYLRFHYYFPHLAKFLKYVVPPLMRLNYPEIRIQEKEIEQLKMLYQPHVYQLEKMLNRKFPWCV